MTGKSTSHPDKIPLPQLWRSSFKERLCKNYQRLFSEGVWSLLGNVVPLAGGLAVVKITTKWVPTAAVGQASLVLGAVVLLNNLLVGPLLVAQLRVYFDYVERGMARWFAAAFRRITLGAAAVAVLLYAATAVAMWARGTAVYLDLFIPAAVLLLAQPHLNAQSAYLEAHRQQRALFLTNTAQRLLHPLLLLALILAHRPPSLAIVASQASAIVVVTLALRPPTLQVNSRIIPSDAAAESRELRRGLLNFGWSLPVGYALMWVVTTTDRFFLGHYASFSDVGIYTVNYGLWSIPYMVLNGWLEVFTRPIVYGHAARGDWRSVRRILEYRAAAACALGVVGTLILYRLSGPIAEVLLGRNYWVSRRLMLVIAVAHNCQAIGYSVVPLFLAAKRPMPIMISTAVAAALTIASGFLLVPTMGILGSAVGTLIAYLAWSILLLSQARGYADRLIAGVDAGRGEGRRSTPAVPSATFS